VSNTWLHRIGSMLKMPLVWGGAVALTAIIAFQAPLAAFVRARRAA